MDKKSFMRGFGTGVIFATLILGISCLLRTSDAAVIKKAKQLGMHYETQEETLFQSPSPAKSAASKAAVQATAGKQTSSGKKNTDASAKATKKPGRTVRSEKTDETEMEQEKQKARKEFENASKELTIKAGEWSAQVSQKLEDMEIISDADDFDAYLEKQGYGDQIKAGTYEISRGADYEEIAKEITSK